MRGHLCYGYQKYSLALYLAMIRCDQMRSELIRRDQMWSELIRVDQTWSELIRHDQMWSELIRCDQNWSAVIKRDQMYPDEKKSKTALSTMLVYGIWWWLSACANGINQVLPPHLTAYKANYQPCIEYRKLGVLVWLIPVHQLAHMPVWRRRVGMGVDDTYHLVTYLTHTSIHTHTTLHKCACFGTVVLRRSTHLRLVISLLWNSGVWAYQLAYTCTHARTHAHTTINR